MTLLLMTYLVIALPGLARGHILSTLASTTISTTSSSSMTPALETSPTATSSTPASRWSRSTRSRLFTPQQTHRSMRLGSVSGAQTLLANPCNASVPNEPSAGSMLNITGNEDVIRSFVRSTENYVARLQDMQAVKDCDYNIPISLLSTTNLTEANLTTSDFLNALYEQYHSLAAHFHVMATDWSEGRMCNYATDEQMEIEASRLRDHFLHHMCQLMPANAAPGPAPYPATHLHAMHNAALQKEFFHYNQCSSRQHRDCTVAAQAMKVLEAASAFLAN